MVLRELHLRNFRNIVRLDVDLSPSVNIIIGPNGSGKTSILESIEFLLAGRSFRKVDPTVLVNVHAPEQGFSIQAKIQDANIQRDLMAGYHQDRKFTKLNGKVSSAKDISKKVGVVVFSPESLSIIKSSPQARRAAIDEVLLMTSVAADDLLMQYDRCLRSRNIILKKLKEEPKNLTQKQILMSINPTFLLLATSVTLQRLNALKALTPSYIQIGQEILKNQLVTIGFDYLVSSQSAIDWNENQVYDAMDLRMGELAAAEIASGQSLIGPHRHEVKFNFQGQDSRTYCSQGQQRGLVLALKLAQVKSYRDRHNKYPILLLDDVFSELDLDRRESLLQALRDLDAQIFVTNTEFEGKPHIEGKKEKIFVIEKGRIRTEDGSSVRESSAVSFQEQ